MREPDVWESTAKSASSTKCPHAGYAFRWADASLPQQTGGSVSPMGQAQTQSKGCAHLKGKKCCMIKENADFELSVTVFSDEENDLVTLLREVAREIKKGSRAGSVGGCLGTAYFQVKEPDPRSLTLREADGDTCPRCKGVGYYYDTIGKLGCGLCHETGHV